MKGMTLKKLMMCQHLFTDLMRTMGCDRRWWQSTRTRGGHRRVGRTVVSEEGSQMGENVWENARGWTGKK